MKYLLCLCFALGASLPILPLTSSAEDTREIQGIWLPISAELAGQPFPEAILKTITLRLDQGNYEALVAGQSDKGTYTLDPAAHPKSITVIGTEGPNKGKTFLAIYTFDGDILRICYDLSGAKRPEEFKTLPDTALYLVTYQRK